jgi:hypothetical protein
MHITFLIFKTNINKTCLYEINLKDMYNAVKAVFIMTAYLVVYLILFHVKANDQLLSYLFLCSPFLLIWMVYAVLKDQKYEYPTLGQQEEWGYLDKPKETIYADACYKYMEPFQIEISIADRSQTLLVYPGPNRGSYDIFEDQRRLGIIYRDDTNDSMWCSKDPIPVELINLIGDKIDAYEE